MNGQSQQVVPVVQVPEERPRWTPSLTGAWWFVVLSPVAFGVGVMMSMGDPGASFAFLLLAALPALVCSVVATAVTRRWYAAIPAALVLAAGLLAGSTWWSARPQQDPGIDPHTVAVTVSFDDSTTPECLILPQYEAIAAGDHVLVLDAPAGSSVTITGPAPSSSVVASYERTLESDGVGPSVRLDAGAYTVTCSRSDGAWSTELNVAP